MCNFKSNSGQTAGLPPQIDGRAVLQPAGNRVPDTPRPVKKSLQKSLSLPSSFSNLSNNETHTNATDQRLVSTMPPKPVSTTKAKKPSYQIPVSIDVAGSIAAAQRVQTAIVQAQRKMRIAHYGRTKSMVERKSASVIDSTIYEETGNQDEKRCSFITNYSDPIYVAYHDEEWGMPVHDDKMLFELLVLSGAQVGSDWTAILKKREDFRHAFAGFDSELVAKFTEKQMALISTEHGLDLAKVHGVVDNAKRILEVKRDFGSFDKYLWAFVNYKPLAPNYKFGRKIPVKTSKSESISKDMVRRGFRFVGPTVIHSFMQAAGLTNDHLISCTRHRFCSTNASFSY
ncbi:DNA glycosylase superfamily protein [Rhynchospora pubera]|uniref:DNA glycosylase superfamily protein n=1 Tax=Rhynchospora pubera TaxID=906938 RepID=A0AAV8HJX1_9POAL|nr:DNA glycosylase superfamily protein [Rhynchospora pubera]